MVSINEISKRYNIDVEKLKLFEKHGFIKITDNFDGEELKKLSALCTLYNCGMSAEDIKKFMSFNCSEENGELLKFLNKYRNDLLDKIHSMEKNLNNLDFIIYKVKNKIQAGKKGRDVL